MQQVRSVSDSNGNLQVNILGQTVNREREQYPVCH